MKRRAGFSCNLHWDTGFKNKLAEPFMLSCADYPLREQNQPIHMATHKGQGLTTSLRETYDEMDGHVEVLHERGLHLL